MHYALLPERGLIRLSGDDSVAFLQGLVSNDVACVQKGQMIYAALLSPQGRFQHDFFLLPWSGAILIDVDKARLPDLMRRLAMYKLRAKVTMEEMKTLAVVAAWGMGSVPDIAGAAAFADPRLPELGWRIAGDAGALPVNAGARDYDRMRLALGVPDGARDMIVDKSLLLEFGFDALHGIDFNKGCYVGQEVTARSKHRGTLRKSIYKIQAGAPLPEPGTPVYADETPVGEMRSGSGNIGLALLRTEDVEKAQAQGGALRCGGASLKAQMPQWITADE